MARVSNYIDRRQAGNFQKAIEQAERIGRPLNLFVSINFRYTRCRAENASACFRRILKHHFSQWLSYKSKKSRRLNFGKPTFVWVVENKPGDHGAHWLVHVPHSLQSEFKEKLPKWLEKCAGPVLCPRSIKIKPAPTPKGAGRYMLKGINPKYGPFYRVRPEGQGEVHGKRCGLSKNLGLAARERFNMKKAAA